MPGGIDDRVAALLETSVRELRPIGSGGFGQAMHGRLADGREIFVKADEQAPARFFEQEADGLRWLAETGGVATPGVLAAEPGVLVLEWLESGSSTQQSAADFGRQLAITHGYGHTGYGRDEDGFVGSEPLPGGAGHSDWPSFYAQARLQPFLSRAVDAGRIGTQDRQPVEQVIANLDRLAGPGEPPARLHGDLWSGNVQWTPHGAAVIDPAAHGGHRETDLAMLALFGLPHLDTVVQSYDQTYPLSPGWQQRVPLHQLFPLLVHAVIFGGPYGQAAGDAARRSLTTMNP
jgi:fructosamine-3-kinase